MKKATLQVKNDKDDMLLSCSREYKRLWDAYCKNDDLSVKAKSETEKKFYELNSESNADARHSLNNYMLSIKANSLEGAAIQLMLIYDKMLGHISPTKDNEGENALARAAFSVLGVLEQHISIRLEEHGLSYFMPIDDNPWRNVGASLVKQAA